MNPIRHKSPRVENNLSNNYFISPEKKEKESNIINFNNPEILSNNNNNNQLNYNYNLKNYNYYEEIAKAFNFITFVLRQKDKQIKELKLKIKDLQIQLNDLNDTNLMTFNKKDINLNQTPINKDNNLNSNKNNFKVSTFSSNQNKVNIIPFNSDLNKYNQLTHNLLSDQTKNNNMNNNIKNKNDKLYDNNINISNKIRYSTNINKINNYRNNIEIAKKLDNNNNYVNSQLMNKQINMNINEHSNEKKIINKIRKDPYHTNINQNVNVRNRNITATSKNCKNYTTETDSSAGHEKIKIVTFDHSMSNLGKPNSKSNSFTLSDDGNIIQSKNDVKNYLKEVKSKLEPQKFKKFIALIKSLIKNKNNEQKNQIVLDIKNIIADKILISKFENIMKIK